MCVTAGLAAVTSVALMTCAPKNGAQATATPASAERGKYLVTVGGCNDCHTPWVMGPQGPGPDMNRMLSGHPSVMKIEAPAKVDMPWMWAGDMTMTAFSGPWGVSCAANLTPDSLTGIGAWTQDVFIQALRTGKHMGKGRQILPPMPWENMKNMTDEDLASIFMYLQTIPKISNQVQEPVAGMMPPGGMPPGGPGGMPPGGAGAPPPTMGGAPMPPPTGPMVPATPGGPPMPVKKK